MARKTIYVDDLTGEESPTPLEEWEVKFNGKTYKLEVKPETKNEINKRIATLLSEGSLQDVKSGKRTRKPAPEIKGGKTQTDVRAWAEDNNISVKPNGKVANKVVEAYNSAH